MIAILPKLIIFVSGMTFSCQFKTFQHPFSSTFRIGFDFFYNVRYNTSLGAPSMRRLVFFLFILMAIKKKDKTNFTLKYGKDTAEFKAEVKV